MATINNDAETADVAREGLVARCQLFFFFLLSFVLTWGYFWLIWAPLHLPDALIALGGFGPAVSAFLVLGISSGKPGVLRLLRSIVHWHPRLGSLVAPSIAAVMAFGLVPRGRGNQLSEAPNRTLQASVLPRDRIIPLSTVKEILPEMNRETATGQDETAVGKPNGNRSVTYATAAGSQRVVISIDQYRTTEAASAAYQQAFQMSQEVPGAKGEPVSNLGQRAFIGVATQGKETHVGGGALYRDVIVTVTLQGYDGTKENKARVTAIILKQAAKGTP
jgi:hypothetical protein